MLRAPGKFRFGGHGAPTPPLFVVAQPMRVPQAKFGGRKIWPSWKHGVPDLDSASYPK